MISTGNTLWPLVWRCIQFTIGVVVLVLWKSDPESFEDKSHTHSVAQTLVVLLAVAYAIPVSVALVRLQAVHGPGKFRSKWFDFPCAIYITSICLIVVVPMAALGPALIGGLHRYNVFHMALLMSSVVFLYWGLLHMIALLDSVSNAKQVGKWKASYADLGIISRLVKSSALYFMAMAAVFYDTVDRRQYLTSALDTERIYNYDTAGECEDPSSFAGSVALVSLCMYAVSEVCEGAMGLYTAYPRGHVETGADTTFWSRKRAKLLHTITDVQVVRGGLKTMVLVVCGACMVAWCAAYHNDYKTLCTGCSNLGVEASLRYGDAPMYTDDDPPQGTPYRNKCVSACGLTWIGTNTSTLETRDDSVPCFRDPDASKLVNGVHVALCCPEITAIFSLGEYEDVRIGILILTVVYHMTWGGFGIAIELAALLQRLHQPDAPMAPSKQARQFQDIARAATVVDESEPIVSIGDEST